MIVPIQMVRDAQIPHFLGMKSGERQGIAGAAMA